MAESWATLLSYRLHDLLMFSAATYFGLFELINRRTWPAPLMGELIMLGVLVMALRRPASRAASRWTAVSMSLATVAACAAVALLYFRDGFAAIHWLGPSWSAAFLAHAVLGLAVATRLARSRSARAAPWAAGFRRQLGLALWVAAAAWPVLAPVSMRPLWQAEVVGLAPDATVLLCLGLTLLLRLSRLWSAALLVVPLAWCIFTGATLWAMNQPQALVLPLAGAMAVVSVLLPGRLGR